MAATNSNSTGNSLTNQTGSGAFVGSIGATLGSVNLGTVASGVLTNATGLPLTTGLTATFSNGGIVYSGSSAFALLSGTATANQILVSGANSAPSWSTATFPATAGTTGTILRSDGTNIVNTTATYPATTTANQLLYSSATNTIGGLSSANSAVLVTNSSGVPAFSSTMTNGQVIIGSTGATPTAAALTGTANQVIVTNGAGTITFSTPQNIGTTSDVTFNQLIVTSGGNTATLTGQSLVLNSTTAFIDLFGSVGGSDNEND